VRLFLDANVLFSAALRAEGNARALFLLARPAKVTLCSSTFAIEEASRNLRTKRPESLDRLSSLLAGIEIGNAPSVKAMAAAAKFGLESKDLPILAGAIAAGADLLITGDRRHFASLFGTSAAGVQILPPAAAVLLLLDRIERRRK
jgi:predicted nucleic acid-binding protein